MKKVKAMLILIVFIVGLLISSASCVVLVKEDNGRHRGWFKNPKNPHNVFYSEPQKGKSRGNNKK